LGLTSYYRRFIKGYSKIAEPLNAQLQKNIMTKWGPKCQEAFEELQKRLTTAILAFLDFQKPFSIYCDASDFGLGAILQQLDENRKERVI
jgi:hypothetical protein